MNNEVKSFDEIIEEMESSLDRMDKAMDGLNQYGLIWLIAWLCCCAMLIVLFAS